MAMKYMVLFVCLMIRVWGNGGGYHVGVDFTGSVAPFSPVGTEQIQILDEKLDIVLKHKHVEVKVRYLMRNVGNKTAKVQMGFPVEDVVSDWGVVPDMKKDKKEKVKSQYCRNYQIVLNGKLLKHSYQVEPFGSKSSKGSTQGKLKSFPGSERFKGIEAWMVSEMKIAEGADAVVEISYQSIYDESAMFISEDGRTGPWFFKYRLSTGGVWHGPIKKGKISVTVDGVNPQGVIISKPVNRFKREGDAWVWSFENLEPTLADDLTIQARPKYEQYGYYGDIPGYRTYTVFENQWYIEQVQYSAKASSALLANKGISYGADNVKTLWDDKAFAWAEGKPDHGIGEILTLTMDKPTSLHALSVQNGYTKSDSLFAQNTRVKEATLIINGKQKLKVTLKDHADDQWLPLSEVKSKIESIQFVIDSVYPGTQFKDTCLSSIALVEKLKQKPKRYGAR